MRGASSPGVVGMSPAQPGYLQNRSDPRKHSANRPPIRIVGFDQLRSRASARPGARLVNLGTKVGKNDMSSGRSNTRSGYDLRLAQHCQHPADVAALTRAHDVDPRIDEEPDRGQDGVAQDRDPAVEHA